MNIDYWYLLFELYWILPVLLATYLSYKFLLYPYLMLVRLKRQIKGKYTAYEIPFSPYGVMSYKRILDDFKKYGDSLHMMRNYVSKHDLLVAHFRNRLFIGLAKEELIQEFLVRQKQGFYSKFDFISFEPLIGHGLFLSQSSQWRYKRKIMSTVFNYDFVKSKIQIIKRIATECCLQAKLLKGEGKKQIDIFQFFQTIFGNVVIKCFFGEIQLNPIGGKKVFQFLSDLIDKLGRRKLSITSLLFLKYFIKFKLTAIDRQIDAQITTFREYSKQKIHQIIQLIKENKLDSTSQGLIAKLIREKRLVQECSYNQKIQKGYYTYIDLIDQMCTFSVAGIDTTSNAVTCLIYKLAQRRQVQEKIRKQIKQVLNDQISNISIQTLKKMNYLRYAQMEILRIMPPAPQISRKALEDHKIGEINIPKGSQVSVQILSLQHNQKYFENPHQFIPQRWEKLQNSSDISQHFMPFFAGQRVCIGQQLALIESKIAIIAFLLNFKNGQLPSPPRYTFRLAYGAQNVPMKFDLI